MTETSRELLPKVRRCMDIGKNSAGKEGVPR
jgi:hypothetical protein